MRLGDDDEELPREVAALKVEHMDGLRVDRVRLSVHAQEVGDGE